MQDSTHKHNFIELPSQKCRGGNFKMERDGNGYDQSVSYTMLYCAECGETKEIVCSDDRSGG
jgi:hypothetical protein